MKKFKVRQSVPVEKIGEYMNEWQCKKPDCVKVDSIGKSGTYDIYCAVFTDTAVPDENKQNVLVIAQHSGMEITGMTTAMSLGNFLASDNQEAEEFLKKLKIVVVPCPNPYSYSKQSPEFQFRNEAGIDEYTAFGYEGARKDGNAPAAETIQKLIDEYKPELLLDLHGVLGENQLVIESCGISAFAHNKFYNAALERRLLSAGDKYGIGQYDNDFRQELRQTDRGCTDEEINARFMLSANGAVAPVYSYVKYHTIAASYEIAWEQSGLEKVLEALRAGCEVNDYEYYSGYPTRTVISYGHNFIRAWGDTAEKRRKSRIELWEKRNKILVGISHPEYPGLSAVIVSTSPELSDKHIGNYYRPMREVCENMKLQPGVDAQAMTELFDDFYETYAMASLELGRQTEIANGMTVRIGIPFRDAEVTKVLYNGIEWSPGELDGYTVTKSGNWVFVDINIPPHKVAPFAIAMVKYDCTTPKCGIIEF